MNNSYTKMRYFKAYVLYVFPLVISDLNGFSLDDFPQDCGKTRYADDDKAAGIINVTHAKLGEFPWIARIGVHDFKSKFFYCSGSLIHPSYVLTAAHCGQQSNIVRLGDNNLNNEKDCQGNKCAPPYQDIDIDTHLFSAHCRVTNVNDMSILSLKKPATINEFVRPICVPRETLTLDYLRKQSITTVGWGVTYSGWGVVDSSKFRKERDLQYVEAPIVDRDECNKNYIRKLNENELCVGYPECVDDPCVGDSGGPLMVSMKTNENPVMRKYIVGVASHNLQLCQKGEGSPVMYTDVSSFVDWMVDKIDLDISSKSKSKSAKQR
ncbi:venom protease-like [Anoplophora glabripennis]|uniref:venom protease-like n=1 Tax=Anoplophora glabripennis TaxID=217634 RepID=UPI0008736568|nr:venom protease-like [Anoplophora glabripennis]